jgi:hypothetical protein
VEPILAALEVESFGKPVRVEFTKTGGVISHTIFLVNGVERMPVLASRINAPGIPCFTELHRQDDLLFLTGADGHCHWSMSIESRQESERPGFVFDVACRIKDLSLELCTEYSVHARGELRVDAFDDSTRVDVVSDASVRIAVAGAAPTTVPATVRWKYRVH